MTERALLASSASRTHSKTETVQQKAAVLVRDDSGVFSASPSPLTPSRQLSVFSPPPSEAMSMCTVTEDRSPETCSIQEESPLVFQTRNKTRTATEGDFGNAPPQQDILSQAFSCLEERGHQQWTACGHAHCESISNQWQHLSSCPQRNSLLGSCDQCTAFQKLVLLHAVRCTSDECVVTLCPDAKRQLQSYAPQTPQNPPKTLLRSNSFTATSRTPAPPSLRMHHRQESFDDTLASPSTSYTYLQSWHELNQLGIGPLPVGLVMSYKLKAEQIVAELEMEKSLEDELLASSGTDPGSKPVDQVPASAHSAVFPGQPGILSPIEEHPTPVASPCKLDEEGEGKRLSILHELDRTYLTPGMDGLYLHPRDYYLNEHLGSGGFGTCAAAKDRHTDELFVIKSNKFNDDSMIDSIRAEVDILSLLSKHENIIRFLGAMLEEDLKTGGRKCSLMLELAEHGSLADMLKDDDGRSEALPLDQSLYYLQQILQGVYYLHSNSVLHLDIKAENVLVLNGGKTVKLTDFGTAVHVDDVARRDTKTKGLTPHFTAPEIVRGFGPTFSSDVWSSVCVLIQLLTGDLPGCSQQVMTRENMMYMIGHYKDKHLDQLFPYLSDVEETDSNAAALIRDVLVEHPVDRPSALQLLSYPSIVTACEYEQYFDTDFSQNQEYSIEEGGGAELELNGSGPNSNGSDLTLDATESYVTPPTKLPLLITGDNDLDVSLDYPMHKKFSTDSGVSSRLDRTNSAASTLRLDSGDDSGIDTPFDQSTARQMTLRAISTQEQILEEREYEGDEEQARLPERALSQPEASLNIVAINGYRQRSASAVCRRGAELPSNNSHFNDPESEAFHSLPSNVDSGRLTEELERMGWVAGCPKQRPNSVPLMHSHSAPVVMSESEGVQGRRRKEGSEDGWSKAPERLRRSSSEVYVERGPDIDTPEEKKKKRELELIAKQAAERENQVVVTAAPESCVAMATAPPPGSHTPPRSRRAATDSNCRPPQGGGRSSDSQGNRGNGRHGYSRRPATAGARLQSSSQQSSDSTGHVIETLV